MQFNQGDKMKKLIIILMVGSLFMGCAPVFSDLQSAKLIGKDNYEITPHYSKIYYREEDNDSDDAIQTHYGVQFAYGLNNKIDLRSRLEIIKLNKDLDDVSFRVLSLGIKYSLIENRISSYLPISFSKNTESDDNAYKQIEPTLLFTVPLNDNIDINSSIKVLLPFFEDDDNDPFYAINIGGGFNNFNNWVVRPEIGLLFMPDADGFYQHISIGLSRIINRDK